MADLLEDDSARKPRAAHACDASPGMPVPGPARSSRSMQHTNQACASSCRARGHRGRAKRTLDARELGSDRSAVRGRDRIDVGPGGIDRIVAVERVAQRRDQRGARVRRAHARRTALRVAPEEGGTAGTGTIGRTVERWTVVLRD
jgi:hypothetical protein